MDGENAVVVNQETLYQGKVLQTVPLWHSAVAIFLEKQLSND
jgi:hypothetical protein